MEIENTPNENLITNEDSIEKNKKFDAQLYFLHSENNTQTDQSPITIAEDNQCCEIICIFLITLAIFIPLAILNEFINNHKILFFIFVILCILLYILTKMKCKNKIVFSKNTQKNKFYIKRYNFINIPILYLEFSLGNYYIKISWESDIDKDGGNKKYYKIYLYNQFIDTSEINLDTTNIKNIPIKLIYIFPISIKGYNKEGEKLENKLNNFICAKNFKNPFAIDMQSYAISYLNIEKNKRPSSRVNHIKYSDYFFTFFFNYSSEKHFGSVNGVIRIDFIYSKNFDTIFIGVVKNGEKSYAKTFEFKMDNIDKFILQNFEYNTGFYLKVIFKDKQIQDIWPIENKNQFDLEGLIYLLNERLIN